MHTPARVALGLFVSILSLIAPAALGDNNVTATKSASGSFVQGTNVTYTIVMTNNMAVTQPNNAGSEFRDPLPSALMFVSASASSGTASYLTTIGAVAWDGSIPAGGSVTITIVATINPAATGVIANQGQTFYDADGNGSNESSKVTDDPSTATANDATSFSILQSGIVSATKSVSGSFVHGTDVTYTIVMTNNMTITQNDNDGHEFMDSLPDNLTLVSVSATSGTITTSDNSVLWDGSLAAGASVTMTIVATISPIVIGEISNQGQTIFDRDGDNQNESNQATDDPSTEAAYDATRFDAVQGSSVFELSEANYDVSESTTTFDVTVNRSGSSAGTADVTYTIAAGTAQSADFAAGSGTLSFADGETSKTFPVTIVDDSIDEPDQTIALSLSDPTNGASLGAQSTATITIQDDDAPPTLSIDDVTLTEGDSGTQQATFTITKTGETEFTITVDATPTAGTASCCGVDYSGPISGMTFFPSTTTRTAQLTIFGDTIDEADETVFMDLSNAVNATIDDGNGVLTIVDNDPAPQLVIDDISFTEGNSDFNTATLTVTLVGSTSQVVTVDYTVAGGTATCCGNDFSASDGTLTFSPPETTQTIPVTILGDMDYEPDETVLVNLSNATNATIADDQGVITILTDDIVPASSYTATKTVSGSFFDGSTVTYTVVLTNNAPFTMPDNPGDELNDVLPAGLTLVSADATSGTAAADTGTNTVTWNGSIASGESVTITITATINAPTGTISNQGTAHVDLDNSGTNETDILTDEVSFNVIQSGIVTSTMSVSGTFVQGTDVTYTVVMTNNMSVAQPDNFGHEWTDNLPSGLTIVSVDASSGTTGKVANIAFWDGSIASGDSVTLTIVATISATASGTLSNQGQTIFDRDGDNQNESSQVTDDPSTAASYDATNFNVIQSGIVTSTMSVSGTFVQGTNVTYTVVMTNNMSVTQPDNFGHEWTDILPSGLTIVSVSATSGTAGKVANIAFWDGSLASGGSATLTIVATISATASGTISNQGQTIFDRNGDSQNESEQKTDDPSTAASYDATSFNVVQSGIVTSTMSVSGTLVQGTNVTYTVVMTNNMSVTQPDNFGHEWTDILPSGLTIVSVSATSGTTGKVANIAFWDGSIASGASVTLTIVATISATASGTISNQGQTIFDRNGDSQNESSQVTDDPSTAASYDATSFNVVQSGIVTSTMSVSGTLVQGTNVTYTVVMTNNMSVTQPDNFGHEWTDILPSGLTIVSVSATSGTTGKVANIAFWDGSLASGGSATLTIVATISATASGTISNQGQTIFDRNSDSQNESEQVTDDPSTAASYDTTSFNVIQSGIVTSTMSVSGTFVQGTNVTYTVVMTNNMTVTQPDNFGHEWTDILPSGITPVSVSATSGTIAICCSNSIVFWDGSITSGASVTLTIVATIGSTANGTISNQGQTIFDRNGDSQNESEQVTDDPSTAASYDATSFNVIQSGIVTSTMSVSGTLVQGTNVTYTVVMTNNMTVTQPDNFGHEWTDILPSGITPISVSATSGTIAICCSNSIVFWDGSIASGGSVTLTIVATIGSTASGTISNQGQTIFDRNGDSQNESSQVTDDPSTAASYDATSFNVVQSGIVTSTMSVSGTFIQGTNVTYTVVMTNNMTVTQPDNFGHEWTDILPSGLTIVSVSATSGTTGSVSNIAYWDGSIASGGSVTLTIVATIGATASGTISNQGQTIFDRNGDSQNESSQVTDDPSTAASYDATSFTVIANQADLSLTMSYTPSVPGPSDNITYTLVVSNGGPLTATNVVVSDDRPNDATFQSVSTTQGSCTTADPVVCSVGSLANGASATITLVVKAPSSYDPLTNSATATSDLYDPTPASASASITCMKSSGKPCKK